MDMVMGDGCADTCDLDTGLGRVFLCTVMDVAVCEGVVGGDEGVAVASVDLDAGVACVMNGAVLNGVVGAPLNDEGNMGNVV